MAMGHRPMVLRWLCLILMVALGLLAGCAATNTPAVTSQPADALIATPADSTAPAGGQPASQSGVVSPEIAARVNGQPIMRLDFERQVARFQAAMIAQGYSFSGEEGRLPALQVRKQVLEAMIDQVLIEQAAAAQGIVVSEDVLRQRIENDIAAAGGEGPFQESLQRNGLTRDEYEQMMRSTILADEIVRRLANTIPKTAKQVHIRQILVDDAALAQELRRQLDAGADFAELARTYSRDESSRADGGDRGFLPLGSSALAPELENAIANLSAGQIAGPIASPYGYYLVQVVEIEENRPLSPEMLQGLTQEAFIHWIEQQRAHATIERLIHLE